MNRVRFAPSPTGSLHVGGVRTALYNWLWARQTNGKFILRIEDTDYARNDPASYDGLLKALDWLGLNWDEGPIVGGDFGPYTQSERRETYKKYVDQLIADGKAYRCACTPDDLNKLRKAFVPANPKDAWKYPGVCRDKNVPHDVPHVVRFKVDHGDIVSYNDLVFGSIKVPTSSLYDFIIVRENGVPLYNLAATIDDHEMKISLVARGCDHMINTAPQILLYQAMGWEVPAFAHLPMMLNMDGEKLSKRDGSASVDQFQALGYSANGLLNYLVRFGWAYGDKELFTLDEMVKLFSWKACKKADGRFDLTKASAINAKNLLDPNLVSDETYAKDFANFYADSNVEIIKLIRNKAKNYKEASEMLSFIHDGSIYSPPKDMIDEDKAKVRALLDLYSSMENPVKNELLAIAREYCNTKNYKFGEMSQLLRYYFTHRLVGPDIYQVIEYLLKAI